MTRVHVIGTGGTIVSRRAEGASGSVAVDSIADLVPSSSDIDVSTSEVFRTGSYRLGLRELRLVVEEIEHRAVDPEIDGIVVTHGTDTMEETAYLADLVHAGDKPVIFTGAQRGADEPDTDGPRNLSEAIEAAADPVFRGIGVGIAFAGQLFAAKGARKVETLAPTAFEGPLLLGVRGLEGWVNTARPVARDILRLPAETFDGLRVDALFTYPGANPAHMQHALESGADGLVLAGTGAGNAGEGYLAIVEDGVRREVPVVLATRVARGPIAGIYGNGGGADLLRAGAIPAGTLNPFQARILLALLLDQREAAEPLAERFGRHAT